MSKQSSAKDAQAFQSKPIWPICSTCEHFKLDRVKEAGFYAEYVTEKNLRCGLGGFKVGKTATCKKHSSKTK